MFPTCLGITLGQRFKVSPVVGKERPPERDCVRQLASIRKTQPTFAMSRKRRKATAAQQRCNEDTDIFV